MEELEQAISPTIDTLTGFGSRIWAEAFALMTIHQFVAIGVTLLLAVALHFRASRLIAALAANTTSSPMRRITRTLSSISMPIVWVIGLWLALLVFSALGWETVLIRLIASLINAWVVIRIFSTLIPSAAWSRTFAWFAWGIAALNAIGQLDPLIKWMDTVGFTAGELHVTLWSIAQGFLFTGLLLWVALGFAGFAQRRIDQSKTLNPSMKVLISKVLRIALVIAAVIFGLQAVGIDLTAFAVFSGALGLGVGLGMQRTIGNLFAGFSMLADRSIKPGDVIEVETGDGPTYGEVKTLGARYVAVRTRAGTETLIPNELLISNAVTNWSFSDKQVRRGIPIGVAYDTDVELAMSLCIEAAQKCDRVLKSPLPVCQIKGFGDSSVDLELRFWLDDPEGGVANVSSLVYLQIWKAFRAHNIEIPFPQRDLHIKSGLPAQMMQADKAS